MEAYNNDPMRIKSTVFIKSAAKPADYPPPGFPEVAFAGRSNVGKSSLINVIVERKGLVRTSSTPGRTQLINFFEVNGSLNLVDLPGYGYAKVPLEVKRQWGPMMERYLSGRPTLMAVVLILDIRRAPTEGDFQMLSWLRAYGRKPIIVLTKIDKLTKNQRVKQVAAISEALGLPREELLQFSALSREGREDIWKAMTDAAGFATDGENLKTGSDI